MRRHDLDLPSLVMGVVLLLVAIGTVVVDATDVNVDVRWVVPAVLLALGGAGLAGSLTGRGGPTGPSDAESH